MNTVCQLLQKYGPLLARVLFAQLFIVSGVAKINAFVRTAAFMASAGMPAPSVFLMLTIALELGGGIALVLGWRARWIAAAFFGFTFLAAIMFHPFWSAAPTNFSAQLNDFMKNLSIMAGMLYIVVYGPGPLSLGRDSRDVASTAISGKKKKQKQRTR